MTTPEQKKSNLRLALVLASVAIVFFAGFMVRMIFFGR
ncbi:MAG: cytochrome oxidase small assembly protein [Pseudomonadota bacterium]